jgi:radical SAM protein with 4Fe4S-binding SPASM domain
MIALPCSFDNQDLRWGYDLRGSTIEAAWNSEVFEDFRNNLRYSCPECSKRELCLGGCPISREIILCNSSKKCLFKSKF